MNPQTLWCFAKLLFRHSFIGAELINVHFWLELFLRYNILILLFFFSDVEEINPIPVGLIFDFFLWEGHQMPPSPL